MQKNIGLCPKERICMGENDIKVGRISSRVERTLGISIVKDVEVYMLEQKLDEFAKAYPKDYLRKIDCVTTVLRQPDFVAMSHDNGAIAFIRIEVSTKNAFFGSMVIVKNTPTAFTLDSLSSVNFAEPDCRLDNFGQFARVDY